MKTTIFRKATPNDQSRCWQIISSARRRMAVAGRDQWQGEYPSEENVRSDIDQGIGYVLCLEGVPVAYGAVVTTGEPAYDVIDGKWLSGNEPFVVLHRLCLADEALGKGLAKRYFREVELWAEKQGINYFRVDTNYDNVEMLHILPSIGFEYCGEITFEGGKRKAFEKKIGMTIDDIIIKDFAPEYQDRVVDFVLGIQNGESGFGFSMEEEPDLINIAKSYGTGFFILAVSREDEVLGTIALQRLDEGNGVLRKMFLRKDLRGTPLRLAQRLYDLFRERVDRMEGLHTLWLDTPSPLKPAHAFYRRNGWKEVSRKGLPEGYVFPDRDSLIFQLKLK